MTSRQLLEEWAALDAVGALGDADRAEMTRALATADAGVREAIAAFYDVGLALARSAPPASPPPELRQRVMARIAEAQPSWPRRTPGFAFVRATDVDWRRHAIPGISFKTLSIDRDRDYALLLLKIEPGTAYPAHHHSGAEDCYVLEGEVVIQGRRLGPGDFHHADPDTDHDPPYTDTGCTVLLVVSARDYGIA